MINIKQSKLFSSLFLNLFLIFAGALFFCLPLSTAALSQDLWIDVDEAMQDISSEEDLENYVDYSNYEEIVDEFYMLQEEEDEARRKAIRERRKAKIGQLTVRTYDEFKADKDPYYSVNLKTDYDKTLLTNLNIYKKTTDSEWYLTRGYVDYATYYGDTFVEQNSADQVKELFETTEKLEKELAGKLGRKNAGLNNKHDLEINTEKVLNKPKKENPKTDTSMFFRLGRWSTNEMTEKYMAKQGDKKLSISGYKMTVSNKRVKITDDGKTETTSMSGLIDGISFGKHWDNLFWYTTYGRPVWMNQRYFWTSMDFVIDMENYAGYTWRNLSDDDWNQELSSVSVYAQHKKDNNRFFAEYSKYENAADLWYNRFDTKLKKLTFYAKYYRKRPLEGNNYVNFYDFTSWDKVSASASISYDMTKATRLKFKVDHYDSYTYKPGSETQYSTAELQYSASKKAKFKFYYKWGRSSTKDSAQYKGQFDYKFSPVVSLSSYLKFYNSDLSKADSKTTYFYSKLRRKLRWGDSMSFTYYNTGKTGEEAEHKLKADYVLAF
jgi:hypothetical protein